jgi:hypothetical protein
MWCRFAGNCCPKVWDSILVLLGVSTLKGEPTKHIRNFEHKSCSKPRHMLEKWRLKGPIKYTFLLFYIIFFYTVSFIYSMGRDISVGRATRYGLDGPGFESRWGRDFFRTCPDRPWDPPSLLCKMGTGPFLGVKRPDRGVDHPPHLAPRLKKEQSYSSTPLWDFVASTRVKFIYSISSTALPPV